MSSDDPPIYMTFGAAPAIYGTVVSSIIALVIATPLALSVAIFLSEFAPNWLRQPALSNSDPYVHTVSTISTARCAQFRAVHCVHHARARSHLAHTYSLPLSHGRSLLEEWYRRLSQRRVRWLY